MVLITERSSEQMAGKITKYTCTFMHVPLGEVGGGGLLPEKLGRRVQPVFENPYPTYDHNLRYIYDLIKNLKPSLFMT